MAAGGREAGEAPTVATVLAIDCSWDAARNKVFPALKNAANALNVAVRERNSGDRLRIIGFAAFAVEIDREKLAGLRWHEKPGPNVQAALILAREILAENPRGRRRIMLLVDDEPTAHLERGGRGRSFYAYPPSPETQRETIGAGQACRAEGIEVTVFWVGRKNNRALRFYERLAAEAGVQVVAVAPEQLADAVVEAYERGRRASGGA